MNISFKTPRGLKVRLNPNFVTSLITKELNLQSYFSVLDYVVSSISLICTIFFFIFVFKLPNTIHGMILTIEFLFILRVIGEIRIFFDISIVENFLLPVTGPICELYSAIYKFFIPPIAMIVCTIITGNYYIFAGFIISKILSTIFSSITNILVSNYINKKYGFSAWNIEVLALKLLNTYNDEKKLYSFRDWCSIYSKYIQENGFI